MLKDASLIARYQPDWSGRYGKEYRLMTRLRHIYENLSNKDLDKLVATLERPKVASKLASGSFDFHASAALSALGVKGLLQLAGVLVSSEAKQAISSLVRPSGSNEEVTVASCWTSEGIIPSLGGAFQACRKSRLRFRSALPATDPIMPGEAASKFHCPSCSQVFVWRCEKCRKFSRRYKCVNCGFEGP